MPSQCFSSLRNAANGVLEGKVQDNFLGEGREGMAPEPVKSSLTRLLQ